MYLPCDDDDNDDDEDGDHLWEGQARPPPPPPPPPSDQQRQQAPPPLRPRSQSAEREHEHHHHRLHLFPHLHRHQPPKTANTAAISKDLAALQHQDRPSIPRPASALDASIDEVLDTTAARLESDSTSATSLFPADHTYPHPHMYAGPHSVSDPRPRLAHHPSRIGIKPPIRPLTPGVLATMIPVTITYSSPRLQPPVYIFTDLSSPQWDAVEMDVTRDEQGECHFMKHFEVEAGEYQYKFRLGPGEWWAHDTDKPSVDDGFGNKNNSILVEEPTSSPPVVQPAAVPVEATPNSSSAAQALQAPDDHNSVTHRELDVPAPLMRHESTPHAEPGRTWENNAANDADDEDAQIADDVSPLMKHETLTPPPRKVSDRAVFTSFHGGDDSDDDDDEDEDDSPPLLQHESLTPASAEQVHSPLFRHETNSLGDHSDSSSHPLRSSSKTAERPDSAYYAEIDHDDPTLEHFPTDEQGIIDHIRRASYALLTDETSHDIVPSTSSVTLASVKEEDDDDGDDELDRLHLIEEREADYEAETENVEPYTMLPDDQTADPMTPPMTPKELEREVEEREQEENVVEDIKEIDAEEVEEQHELKALEASAERTWLQRSIEFATFPITWVAAFGLAFAFSALRSAFGSRPEAVVVG